MNYKISFCTTILNRLQFFEQQFSKNLSMLKDDIQWIIVDFGSTDGFIEFIKSQKLPSNVSVVFSNCERWETPHAKNVAHKIATGKVLFNLDCDNLITEEVITACRKLQQNEIFHNWSEVFGDGTYGRIGIHKQSFLLLGGYDEEFLPTGCQDKDLLLRAQAMEFKKIASRAKRTVSIQNSQQEKIQYIINKNHSFESFIQQQIKYSTRGINWSSYESSNTMRMYHNLSCGKFIANTKREWGVCAPPPNSQ